MKIEIPEDRIGEIAEQTFSDEVLGMTFQFEVKPGVENGITVMQTVMRVFVGGTNREFHFDTSGMLTATGSHVSGPCKPSRLRTLTGERPGYNLHTARELLDDVKSALCAYDDDMNQPGETPGDQVRAIIRQRNNLMQESPDE